MLISPLPAAADLLKHDKQLARVAPSRHLGAIPSYMQSEASEAARQAVVGAERTNGKRFHHHKRKKNQNDVRNKRNKDSSEDPLKALSKKK